MTRSTLRRTSSPAARPQNIRLVITKGEYNTLVQEHPAFMQNQFTRLTKKWSLYALTLEGNPTIINQIERWLGLAVS